MLCIYSVDVYAGSPNAALRALFWIICKRFQIFSSAVKITDEPYVIIDLTRDLNRFIIIMSFEFGFNLDRNRSRLIRGATLVSI